MAELNFKAGDEVRLRLAHKELDGRVLESNDKNIVLLKLESGYNIGIPKDNILASRILKKNGLKKVLFTTKCSRGVDFAGDKCNSIVITRFPYPNIQGLFWKILKKEQPEKFMEFYLDKARRDLIQKVARGVRFKGDKVSLWSPDIRVINSKIGYSHQA